MFYTLERSVHSFFLNFFKACKCHLQGQHLLLIFNCPEMFVGQFRVQLQINHISTIYNHMWARQVKTADYPSIKDISEPDGLLYLNPVAQILLIFMYYLN